MFLEKLVHKVERKKKEKKEGIQLSPIRVKKVNADADADAEA